MITFYRQKRYSLCKLSVCLLIAYFLCACSPSEDSELRHYINEVKSRPAKPIEPLPTFEPLPKFIYPEIEERRSPFKPITVEPTQVADVLAPNINRPKQPLESYPLDALRFVGTLKEGNQVWALISQPDGVIARVRPGDYMGKNFGQVVSIKNDMLKLVETVQVAGKWEKKEVILKINASEQ
ncbi:type IV pilus biogenesis protein PilP [Legionella adelaidensis]|uniref:Type IV pilus biogenesis protein PilP n=1 Tax=Legionella adelaidensis TaxID=45056 RepID=A0A0W0R3Z6_9GAMM|nr:pilus assembly protein PilP [Legionella adelaidensis]KTC65779.1 type IV pilus biogenesis protein PilP [Legionella adelaidensis]